MQECMFKKKKKKAHYELTAPSVQVPGPLRNAT